MATDSTTNARGEPKANGTAKPAPRTKTFLEDEHCPPCEPKEIECELLTALFYGWDGTDARWALSVLEKADFAQDEHGQLLLEMKGMAKQKAPMTRATLIQWLRDNGGLKRLGAAAWLETDQQTLDWLIGMHLDYPGLTSAIRWYVKVLRAHRIRRAKEKLVDWWKNGVDREWLKKKKATYLAIPRL